MGSLADFEFNKAPLCDGMIRISELIRDDFPIHAVQDELAHLLALAREEIAPCWDTERQTERLLELFYHEWGFRASDGIYRLSDALWIDKVLLKRQGSAVSLGAIVLWLARQLSLPLVPVIFPTQMLLRVDLPTSKEMWLINPFNGETLDEHTLEVWLKGSISPLAELFDDDLAEADNADVIHKLLDTLKSALVVEQQVELALRVSEVLLQINPQDPYEIRDRGLIYVQLECDHIALQDLNYFIEQCPEDPLSEMIRVQINTISHKQITLH